MILVIRMCCIVSNFYIKSQRILTLIQTPIVVQYPISTSNHNRRPTIKQSHLLYSIQFLHQITTAELRTNSNTSLYSIQFLHQITTGAQQSNNGTQLYSIQFLHQITTVRIDFINARELYSIQFLHQITTKSITLIARSWLYSIQFLHQITTYTVRLHRFWGCIVSNFYIKSQPANLCKPQW